MLTDEYRVRSPLFPIYSEVRHLLRLWDGVRKAEVLTMIQDVHDQTGTPQNPLDSTEPDVWIAERLSGRSRELARMIWEQSRQAVNPRYVYGTYLFVNNFDLLTEDSDGVYSVGLQGEAFAAGDEDVLVLRRLH